MSSFFEDYHDIAARLTEKHGYKMWFDGFAFNERKESTAFYGIEFDACYPEGEKPETYKYMMYTLDGKPLVLTVQMPRSAFGDHHKGLGDVAAALKTRCDKLVMMHHL